MSWKITKLTGAGNSFLLADLTKSQVAKFIKKNLGQKDLKNFKINTQTRKYIQNLCDSHFGIGSDGFIFLQKLKSNSYQWFFLNEDGSDAEMCGNATRCVARYLNMKPGQKSIRLKTAAGEIELSCLGVNKYEAQMSFRWDKNFQLIYKEVSLNGNKIQSTFIDTGVPHLCISRSEATARRPNPTEALALQSHPDFQPRQTNVTYWAEVAKNKIYAVSFERGVKDFTLACGTGAVAAAIAYMDLKQTKQAVSVEMPGGLLKVRRSKDKVFLSGPATLIADIELPERL